MTTTYCKTSMEGPLGLLSTGLATTSTEVVGDIDGEPPGGAAGRSDSDHQ
jgi:hypothetical protein